MRKFRSPHSLLVGIAVGVFLGLYINLLDNKSKIYIAFTEEDTQKVTIYSNLPSHLMRMGNKNAQTLHSLNIWLRCIVLLASDEQNWPEKNLMAIRDTWAKKCNETLFFTDSPKLQQRFGAFLPSPNMHILLVEQSNSNAIKLADGTLMSNLIKFLSEKDQNGGEENGQKIGKNWTVITNGQSYLHLDNLRFLLAQVDENAAIILGRKVQIQRPFWRSVLSNLFPFSSLSNWPVHFSLSSGESPLIFSQLSLRLLAAQCADTFRWSNALIGGPTAGRMIGDCSAKLGIALWDPVDQESRPLIVDANVKTLFSRIAKNATIGGTEKEIQRHLPKKEMHQMAKCCSDRAIAFALLNHKEQRLIDFGVNRLKVFGT
ncbi:hypothetical protein niasHT_009785 [Heterodera trifolii]|uniref:Uncharacterized protein n=1 Tax=Heterodera trifolii TaxID=157864 RepID=A0ABD2MEH9_9BILA